jgi:hypothetical protein
MKRRRVGRYHTKRDALYFEDSDFDEDGHFKETGEEQFADQSFLAHAERLSAWARAFLRERGLPDCRGVRFPPGAPEEWEACEEMPDSFRARPRRNWSALDFYLREHRDVQHDEAEDMAARIVCVAYEIKQARNDNARMELAGQLRELEVLSHIYAEEDRRRKKPRRTRADVWAEQANSLGPCGTVIEKWEAWSTIPEGAESGDEPEPNMEIRGVKWCVYREANRLCAKNDRTGVAQSITREHFFKKHLK